jgi:hypothetical protein
MYYLAGIVTMCSLVSAKHRQILAEGILLPNGKNAAGIALEN